MHPDRSPLGYAPSSPLSHSMSTQGSLSPPSPGRRVVQKPATRNFHLDMPAYPQNFGRRASAAATPSSVTHSSAISLNRRPQPTPMEAQQRVMSRGQRDFLKQLQMSSTIAASSMSIKPDAPRLDPLGSPKGPVTPLALEQHEAIDYFAVQGAGKFSPAASPGARSSRSDGSIKEENLKKKVEMYS